MSSNANVLLAYARGNHTHIHIHIQKKGLTPLAGVLAREVGR